MSVVAESGRISGTRITVYDVLDYTSAGRDPAFIADVLGLSSAQIDAALRFIEEHKDQVLTDYQHMLERDARGNPPELQPKLEAAHAKLQRMLERTSDKSHAGMNGARPPRG